MHLKKKVKPAVRAVTTDEAKEQLRVDSADDDSLIERKIDAVVGLVERYTGLSLITQTWQLFLDNFPNRHFNGRDGHHRFGDNDHISHRHGGDWWDGTRQGPVTWLDGEIGRFISLHHAPVISVTHLKTFDTSDVEAIFAATNYFVDTIATPGRLALNDGQVWPATVLRPINGVEIEFITGFGAADTDVPDDIKEAIFVALTAYYEHRGDGESQFGLPAAAQQMLEPHRVRSIR